VRRLVGGKIETKEGNKKEKLEEKALHRFCLCKSQVEKVLVSSSYPLPSAVTRKF
jgi:hypothetical protein